VKWFRRWEIRKTYSHCLAEIRTLATNLKGQPLLDMPLLGECIVGELLLFVIGINDVFHNGSGFQRVMPVLGSSMAGTRPLGLNFSYSGCLTVCISLYVVS
jgi:hypothetical protein